MSAAKKKKFCITKCTFFFLRHIFVLNWCMQFFKFFFKFFFCVSMPQKGVGHIWSLFTGNTFPDVREMMWIGERKKENTSLRNRSAL